MTSVRNGDVQSDTALIFAPGGRDAVIAASLLREAGIGSVIVPSLAALVQELNNDTGFVLITEDSLRDADMRGLGMWLAGQPEWSDMPFILLTAQGGSIDRNPQALRYLETLGNVTFAERPFHPTTLVSLARAALRARNRQYEARSRLEAIRVGGERLRVALAAGRLGAWSFLIKGQVLDASPQCKAHFGRNPQDAFSYDDLIASIHPDDLPAMRGQLTAILKERQDFDVEFRIAWPNDDDVHWVEMRGRIDAEDDSGPLTISGVSLNTTQRKNAEAALRMSEERFRAAVDAVHGVLWTNNARGEMEGLQPGWARLTGQTYDEYQGYAWASAVHPDDAQPTINAWNEAVAKRSRFLFEHRVRRADGQWGNFAIRAIPAFNADGSIREWVGVHSDITSQRATERELADLAANLEQRVAAATAELEDSRARLRSIFESSFQYAGEVSPDGIVLDANLTSLEGIGLTIDQVVGRYFWDTPWFSETPGLPEMVRQAVARVAQGESFRHQVTTILPAGPRQFDFSMRPVFNPEGKVITVVPEAIDVTERRQAEERLLQSQKLETIGQLTGGVAHDFNNLLTPIVSSLETLRGKVAGDPGAERWAAVGLESAERARVLIDRLLSFSRRQTLETKPVDVAALVNGMHDLVARSIGSSIEIKIVSADNLPPARADPGQLELSLLNLCINSRDAMPDGGRIDISVDLEHGDVPFDVDSDTDFIRVSVRDTGSGMDAETAGRSIEPFYTTKAVGQGTGLGLSMVHGLVAQLGGGMRIDSAPGAGTRIDLWLPVADQQTSPRADVPTKSSAEPIAGATLLLVDDEPIVRFVTAELLREAGYDVVEAASAAKAREIVGSGVRPDLLITDQRMPGTNGTDLANEMLLNQPDLLVLIATGYSNMPDMPYPCIAKPFTTADLVERVATLLQTRTAPLVA